MNKFLLFLIIIVIFKLLLDTMPNREEFRIKKFFRRNKKKKKSTPSTNHLKDHQTVYGSKLTKLQLDQYLGDITSNNPNQRKYYDDAIKKMNSGELKVYHNDILEKIRQNEALMQENIEKGLAEAKAQIEAENAKDVASIRDNIANIEYDIDNNFSQQVLANFKQNYNNNMNNRMTNLNQLQSDEIQPFIDELYGYET
jgi:hypothetical protein